MPKVRKSLLVRKTTWTLARRHRARLARTSKSLAIARDAALENYKAVRALLLLMLLGCFLVSHLSGSRISTTVSLQSAAAEYAASVIRDSFVRDELVIRVWPQNAPPIEVKITPVDKENPPGVATVVQAVATDLLERGYRLNPIQVDFGEFQKFGAVRARLEDHPPAEWILRQDDEEFGIYDDIIPPDKKRQARIADRCPWRWINATAVISTGENHYVIPRLRMGRPYWWAWTRFERAEHPIASSKYWNGILNSEIASNVSIISTRTASPTRGRTDDEQGLECESEYPVVLGVAWKLPADEESSWLMVDKPYLISPAESDELLRSLKDSAFGVTGDIKIGAIGLAFMVPGAMLLLSLALSIELRRLSSMHGSAIAIATWKYVGDYRRKTLLDGAFLRLLEELFRAALLAIAIFGTPFLPVFYLYGLWYPVIVSSEFPPHLYDFLLRTPAGWASAVLILFSLHQAALVFDLKWLKPKWLRSQT